MLPNERAHVKNGSTVNRTVLFCTLWKNSWMWFCFSVHYGRAARSLSTHLSFELCPMNLLIKYRGTGFFCDLIGCFSSYIHVQLAGGFFSALLITKCHSHYWHSVCTQAKGPWHFFSDTWSIQIKIQAHRFSASPVSQFSGCENCRNSRKKIIHNRNTQCQEKVGFFSEEYYRKTFSNFDRMM